MGIDGTSNTGYINGVKRMDEYCDDYYYAVKYYDENGVNNISITEDDYGSKIISIHKEGKENIEIENNVLFDENSNKKFKLTFDGPEVYISEYDNKLTRFKSKYIDEYPHCDSTKNGYIKLYEQSGTLKYLLSLKHLLSRTNNEAHLIEYKNNKVIANNKYNFGKYKEIEEKYKSVVYDYQEIVHNRNGHLVSEEIIIKGKIIKSIEYYKIFSLLKEETIEYQNKLSNCIKSVDEIELSA